MRQTTIYVGDERIVVTRHIHFEPDEWILSWRDVQEALSAKDLKKAQVEALIFVQDRLQDVMNDITTALLKAKK